MKKFKYLTIFSTILGFVYKWKLIEQVKTQTLYKIILHYLDQRVKLKKRILSFILCAMLENSHHASHFLEGLSLLRQWNYSTYIKTDILKKPNTTKSNFNRWCHRGGDSPSTSKMKVYLRTWSRHWSAGSWYSASRVLMNWGSGKWSTSRTRFTSSTSVIVLIRWYVITKSHSR